MRHRVLTGQPLEILNRYSVVHMHMHMRQNCTDSVAHVDICSIEYWVRPMRLRSKVDILWHIKLYAPKNAILCGSYSSMRHIMSTSDLKTSPLPRIQCAASLTLIFFLAFTATS
jgi:hypothetical protein